MRHVIVVILLVLVASVGLCASTAKAEPMLQMQPLQYQSELKSGERQKGFVDITNPTAQPVTVELGVQAFKQVDDKGTLNFYDDERLRAGILLDYQEAAIPAHKTLRLFFIADATKLPTGDIFAAIFARTKPTKDVTMSVRLGTLLLLTNGAPGARQATVESLVMAPLQTGSGLKGAVKIKNTAPTQSASGFFPTVTVSLWPFGDSYSVKGSLVYAGNTRTVTINHPGDYIGIYKVTARYGASTKERWAVLITGFWRWLAPIVGVILATGITLLIRFLTGRKKLVQQR